MNQQGFGAFPPNQYTSYGQQGYGVQGQQYPNQNWLSQPQAQFNANQYSGQQQPYYQAPHFQPQAQAPSNQGNFAVQPQQQGQNAFGMLALPPGFTSPLDANGYGNTYMNGFYCPGINSQIASNDVEWSATDDSKSFGGAYQAFDGMFAGPQSQSYGGGETKDFSDFDQFLKQELAKTIQSNQMTFENMADVDGCKKERDPNPFSPLDDARYDIAGDDREWTNWVIPTFLPSQAVGTADLNSFGGFSVSSLVATNSFKSRSDKFERALASCLSSHQKFADPEFKPCLDSLAGFCEPESRKRFENYCWERPETFFQPPVVFDKAFDVNDIVQGSLGDCYLLGTISAIAEYPARIERLFYSKTINNAGIYCVQICVTGIWEDVIVDDLFPCQNYSKKPAFTTSKSGEIWVMLLEKAWAKIHGGYFNISGGLIRETLKDLTGAPAITFFNQEHSPEFHWKNILEADRNRFIMGCGSDDLSKTGDDSQDPVTGLANSHAYSLLAAIEIVNEGGRKRVLRPGEPSSPNNERVLKLRNPWGEGEWKGDWSDGSSKWTPELKKELNLVQANDGIFFIPFQDFQKYFYDYQICYFHDDYAYSAQKYKSGSKDPTVISFNLPTAGEYYFSINQINKRMFRKSDGYAYSQITLFVSRKEADNSFSYIGSVTKADKEMWFKAKCGSGTFVAYILTPWKRKVNEFSFSVYGPAATQLQKQEAATLPSTYLESVMIQRAKADKSNLSSYASQGEPKIMYKFESGHDGLGYFYFTNASDQTQLTATIEFTKSTGVEILPPYSGTSPKLLVGPKEEKILIFKLNGTDAKAEFRIMSSFLKNVNSANQKVKSQGQKHPLCDQWGRDVGVSMYLLNHPGGLSIMLENLSQKSTLVQELRFLLNGCKIEGTKGDSLQAEVGPGQSYLINIIKTQQNGNATIASQNFKIFDT